MEEYITEITDGVLTLVKRKAVAADESTLTANQYFVLMFYVTYVSYVRNYKQFQGNYIYHAGDKVYYLDFHKQGINNGYYISKSFPKIKNELKGRVMIATVNNYSKCISLDDNSINRNNIEVTALDATNITSISFTANWKCDKNVDGYFIDVSTDSTFTTILTGYDNLYIGNVLSYNITGLQYNTNYYYRISAYKNKKLSNYSNYINTITSNITLHLVFDNIANAFATDIYSVTEWNSLFNLPTNGNPFKDVNINGNTVILIDGTNITITDWIYLLYPLNEHLIGIIDNGCITNINAYAFSYSGLINIQLNNSLLSIGEYAFNHCSDLISIQIPNTITTLNSNTLSFCSLLSSIILPSFLTVIGVSCFSNCPSLLNVHIPSSITSIGQGAFITCINLQDIFIYSSVAPTVGLVTFGNPSRLYVPIGATGYNVPPWTTRFGSIIYNL